jgi:hypothetical protein
MSWGRVGSMTVLCKVGYDCRLHTARADGLAGMGAVSGFGKGMGLNCARSRSSGLLGWRFIKTLCARFSLVRESSRQDCLPFTGH